MSTTGHMDLLRLSTAGSVDDGKSTLIGRLLYDTKSIFEDQLAQVEASTKRRGQEGIDLSLLTDGLRAEREQGITIDVAYRYFATPKRKFIIADTPGHVQYTRNMVTGASHSDLAIVLVDARKGVMEQTCRHAFLASLLRIRHIVLAVNKMDLVGFSQEAFDRIVDEFKTFAARLSLDDLTCIPISALNGDNIVTRSKETPWYDGPTLLYTLENSYVAGHANFVDPRFPVQYVIRPKTPEYHDFRGYAGTVAGGVFRPGEEVVVLPSGFTTKVKSIHAAEQTLDEAFFPQSVVMTLEDEIDASRGDMISKPRNQPEMGQDLALMLCWFSDRAPLRIRGKYLLRHTSMETLAMVTDVIYKVDVNTLHRIETKDVTLNDIARVTVRTSAPVMFDPYNKNRTTGGVILVDEHTHETVAAGMIRGKAG
jgi:sulfate adenylyltransferase subunit 1